VVSPSLAGSLGLGRTKSPAQVRGATCQATAPTAAIRELSLAGIALAPQSLVVADVPGYGASQPPEGLIGSDILARFGTVRVDYRAKTVTLVRPQGPAPTGNVIVLGQPNAGPPPGLVKSGPEVGVPLDVLQSPTNTLVSTPVTAGGETQSFIIDTGSPTSSAAAGTAEFLGAASGRAQKVGVGCSGTAPTVSSGGWSLGGSPLPQGHLVSQTFVGGANEQIGGALGADVLNSYGSLILDYSAAHLWLGVG
jgi:Aspartyl protease